MNKNPVKQIKTIWKWLIPGYSRPENRTFLGYLLLFTVLATLLRTFRLGEIALWVDEIESLAMCDPAQGLGFWEQFLDDIQCPLYLAAIWPLVRIHISETMLRLPAVIAGVLAIPAFAVLADKFVGRKSAIWATLLMAINPFHIWHSQDARGYSFIVLFSILSTLFFLRILEQKFNKRNIILYFLTSTAMVLSNLSGLFMILAQLITAQWISKPVDRRNYKSFLIVTALIGLCISPWLYKASQILAVGRLLPGHSTGPPLQIGPGMLPAVLVHYFFVSFFGYSLGPSMHELVRPDRMTAIKAAWPILLSTALVVGTSLVIGIRSLDRRKRMMLAAWIFIPLLAVAFLSYRNVKPFNARYLSATLPFLLLLLATGLASRRRITDSLRIVVLIFFTLFSIYGSIFNPRYAKGDIRSAARWVEQRGNPQETIIIPRVKRVFDHYYYGSAATVELDQTTKLESLEQARETVRRLAGPSRGLWLVLCRTWPVDPDNYLEQLVTGEGSVLEEKFFPGVHLLRWLPAADPQ